MSDKPMLSVQRELLERFVSDVEAHRYGFDGLEEMRALLNEPIEDFNPEGWSIDHSAGRPILMHNKCSVIEAEQAYGLLELIKKAAQHQGEPVAWEACGQLFKTVMGARNYAGSLPISPLFKFMPSNGPNPPKCMSLDCSLNAECKDGYCRRCQ